MPLKIGKAVKVSGTSHAEMAQSFLQTRCKPNASSFMWTECMQNEHKPVTSICPLVALVVKFGLDAAVAAIYSAPNPYFITRVLLLSPLSEHLFLRPWQAHLSIWTESQEQTANRCSLGPGPTKREFPRPGEEVKCRLDARIPQ